MIGSVSVGANVLVGAEPSRWGFLDRRAMNEQAKAHLERVGLDIDPRREASHLSIAEQQLVEIARILSLDARVVFFDEPTSSLPTMVRCVCWRCCVICAMRAPQSC